MGWFVATSRRLLGNRKLYAFSLLACCLSLEGRGAFLAREARTQDEHPSKSPNDSADADFRRRCEAPGVVKCVGFDSEADILPFAYPDNGGAYRASLDTKTTASGAGSLRFEIPSNSGQNSSGGWHTGLGRSFGPGRILYVQFRERFSPEFLKTNYEGNGWKQAIFHMGSKTCGSIELTTQNTYNRGYPQMYTDCGSRSFDVDLKNGDFLYEQGDYNCHRNKPSAASCAYYHPNEWMTFYYEIKVGAWGRPESSIKAWVAYEHKPYKQFVNATSYRLDSDSGPADAFDSITLTPYNTNKPSDRSHGIAYIWYDELIVSDQPIPFPTSMR
jgi:hypothetical protein